MSICLLQEGLRNRSVLFGGGTMLGGLVLVATLLCFVWAVPIIQYKLLNRR
jgi:hypothetical protein